MKAIIIIMFFLATSACAVKAAHTYGEAFNACMANGKKVDDAYHKCTMVAFNYCAQWGCK